MSKPPRGKEFEGFLFVAFMFLGMGSGILLDNVAPGLFIGMGLGFLAMAVADALIKRPPEEEISEAEDKIGGFGTLMLILLGLGFILGGSSVLLGFEIPWRLLGSVFMVLLGIFFLIMALGRLRGSRS